MEPVWIRLARSRSRSMLAGSKWVLTDGFYDTWLPPTALESNLKVQDLCHSRTFSKPEVSDAKVSLLELQDLYLMLELHNMHMHLMLELDNVICKRTNLSIEGDNLHLISNQAQTSVKTRASAGGFSCLLEQTQCLRYQQYASHLTQRTFCSGQNKKHEDQLELDDSIFTKDFSGPGPGDVNAFLQRVAERTDESNKNLDFSILKEEFKKDFRPFLAANCLMLPHGISDVTTASAHGQIHGITKQNPLYLTAFDIMIRVKGLSEEEKMLLRDHLIARRVHVYDTWEYTFGTIEVLEYKFGPCGTFRGECDANFTKDTKGKGGIANISIIIWNGDQLVWAEVFQGIPCRDIRRAECLAALALLLKCEDMNLLEVQLWSDNQTVVHLINGNEPVELNDAKRALYLLLKTIRTRFKRVDAVWKRRELMFLADQVLKEGFTIQKSLSKWFPYLMGRPLFRVSNTPRTESNIKNEFDDRLEGYVQKPESTYFLNVGREEKLVAFQRLVDCLDPDRLNVVIGSIDDAVRSRILLSGCFTCIENDTTTTLCFESNKMSQKRRLVVIWDPLIPKEHYYKEDSCFVVLANEDDSELMKRRKISEINVFTYLYFHRVVFRAKVQKQKTEPPKPRSGNISQGPKVQKKKHQKSLKPRSGNRSQGPNVQKQKHQKVPKKIV